MSKYLNYLKESIAKKNFYYENEISLSDPNYILKSFNADEYRKYFDFMRKCNIHINEQQTENFLNAITNNSFFRDPSHVTISRLFKMSDYPDIIELGKNLDQVMKPINAEIKNGILFSLSDNDANQFISLDSQFRSMVDSDMKSLWMSLPYRNATAEQGQTGLALLTLGFGLILLGMIDVVKEGVFKNFSVDGILAGLKSLFYDKTGKLRVLLVIGFGIMMAGGALVGLALSNNITGLNA